MKVESINLTTQRIIAVMAEMEAISNKEKPTRAEEMRHAALIAEFALLKNGVTPQELAEARMAQLGINIGGKVPMVSRDRVEQWRAFLKSDEAELRSDLQSTSQYGNVTGETYSGSSGTKGGVLVPASYDRRVFNALGQYDEVVLDRFSNVFTTKRRSACTTPVIDDSAYQSPVSFARSTKLGEAFQTAVAPVRAGHVAWAECPQYRSGRFLIALELENDAFASTVSLLEATINQRHAFTFGSDAIATIVAALPTTQNNTSVTSTLSHLDFINTAKQLPRIYRRNSVWLMHSDTQFALIESLEANARPMIDPSGDSFLGRPIAICDSLAAPGAGNNAVALLVDPTYLLQRRVEGGTFVRRSVQVSSGIEYGLAQVEGWMAADLQPALFGSAFPPVAVLNQHA
jgi:HK97 family phage major capsid protein